MLLLGMAIALLAFPDFLPDSQGWGRNFTGILFLLWGGFRVFQMVQIKKRFDREKRIMNFFIDRSKEKEG